MRPNRTLIAGLLFLLLNFTVISFAQQANGQDEAARPQRPQEANPPEAKPADPVPEHPVQQEGKPPHEEANRPPQDKKENKDNEKIDQDKQRNKQQNDEINRNEKNDKNEVREQDRKTENRTASNQDHGRRQGQRIPEDKFRQHFGREHHFKVSQPVIVNNHPRIQYGGYFFEFVDVWPVGWSYSDDCYIDYVDGEYFLFDLLHPGVRIALVVVL